MVRNIGFRRSLVTACLLGLIATAGFSQTNVMTVTVREAPVRATPSFLGKIVTDLAYGVRVEVVTSQGGWVQITIPEGGGTGWLHSSELSQKEIALQAGSDVNSSASGSEVALAGKGFNQQVENQYKSDKGLDYTWVDRMEKISYSPQSLVHFLEAGDLHGGNN